MRPTHPFTILLALVPALLAAGCGTEPEPEAEPLGSSESAQSSAGNCSFLPGCKDLREASDGPFYASVMTYEDAAGEQHRRLAVSYRASHDSSFLLCWLFPAQPSISAVFVVGPEGARSSVSRAMSVSCPTSYGDNGGATNSASLSIAQDEEPELWDTLFPPQAGGSRWYALQIAARNAHGQWDSRYGHNYRLVLQPR